MTEKQAAITIVVGAVLMSFVGLFLRQIETADGFQILFYRAVPVAVLIAFIICIRRKIGVRTLFGSLDLQDVGIGIFLSLGFVFFIFALLNTTIASALFIVTAAPLLSGTLAWLWIGERPHPFAFVAMSLAGVGVLFMIGDGLGSGRTLGNTCAFLAALSFALMLVFVRRCRKTDILGGTMIAVVLSGVYGLVVSIIGGNGLTLSAQDFLWIMLLGIVCIGPGIACVTWGAPHLPAAEVSILILVENALGPVWVWLFGIESVTSGELIGGGIVFASVVAMTLVIGNNSTAR